MALSLSQARKPIFVQAEKTPEGAMPSEGKRVVCDWCELLWFPPRALCRNSTRCVWRVTGGIPCYNVYCGYRRQDTTPPLETTDGDKVLLYMYVDFQKGVRMRFSDRDQAWWWRMSARRELVESAVCVQSVLFVPTLPLSQLAIVYLPSSSADIATASYILHLCGMDRVGCHLWVCSVTLCGVLVYFECTLSLCNSSCNLFLR